MGWVEQKPGHYILKSLQQGTHDRTYIFACLTFQLTISVTCTLHIQTSLASIKDFPIQISV